MDSLRETRFRGPILRRYHYDHLSIHWTSYWSSNFDHILSYFYLLTLKPCFLFFTKENHSNHQKRLIIDFLLGLRSKFLNQNLIIPKITHFLIMLKSIWIVSWLYLLMFEDPNNQWTFARIFRLNWQPNFKRQLSK